ncbi:hypothetical protein GCM10025787_38140 [Saccharopolyspora rosea]|uniref:DUF2637 domain-containing protein n=1 Tax=Saccharopolyspora rosea TaxID=524884 RepID=A0ABW3FPX0_9PSEU
MSSRKHERSPAADDEQRLVEAGRTINVFVWLVASVVMLLSAYAGAQLLASHGVPQPLGLAGGLAVDAALVVALIGDRHLHRYGQRAPWGTGLRWATAGMSLVLNCGQSAERGDWVAAGLHAIFPVLLIVLTEASQGYQLAFARAVLEAQKRRQYQPRPEPSTAPVPAAGTRPEATTGTRPATTAEPVRRQHRAAAQSPAAAQRSARPRKSAGAGRWDAAQWTRAVELVAVYQREHGRDPKLAEFHSELRMSRNAASPLRNAVLAAVAEHGVDAAKTAVPGTGEQSHSESGTGAQVVELRPADTDATDTAETVQAR